MKSTIHPNLATRLTAAILLGIILLTSVSCSAPDFKGKEKDNAKAIEQLVGRFNELESGLSGLVFWQVTAALLFVLSGFALVGGAALGSRARRDQARLSGQPRPKTSTLDDSAT